MPINIDIPENRETILFLLTVRSVHERAWATGKRFEVTFTDESIGMGELRTHPDLGGLLYDASRQLPDITHGYVLGYDVLVNSAGIIFALGMGMMYLAFRIYPPERAQKAVESDEPRIENLSSEWQSVSAFGGVNREEVLELSRQALENVSRLSHSL